MSKQFKDKALAAESSIKWQQATVPISMAGMKESG